MAKQTALLPIFNFTLPCRDGKGGVNLYGSTGESECEPIARRAFGIPHEECCHAEEDCAPALDAVKPTQAQVSHADSAEEAAQQQHGGADGVKPAREGAVCKGALIYGYERGCGDGEQPQRRRDGGDAR